jgi:hypothetical protein
MTDLRRNFVWTAARRILFVAVLLLIGAITVSVFYYVQKPNAPGLPPIGILAWGMDSVGIVLAVWLVTRSEVWRSWRGWLRVATYIIAYTYGRMLFSTTQDWWSASDGIFRLPGSEVKDYARPALDLLSLVMFTWLLTPVVIVTATVLSSTDEAPDRTRRFSISGLMGFMTIAAIAISWISFLTSDLAPQTYYSHLSQADAIKEWIGMHLPFTLPPLVAVMVMLFGLTKRWWLAMLTLLGAIALDGFGSGIVASILEQLTGQQHGGILGGPTVDHWLYVCGRSLTAWCAFATARLMGVRPTIGGRESQSRATEPRGEREPPMTPVLKS